MIVAASSSSGSGFFLIIIVAFLLLWLIVVRPQRKRQSQQKQMLQDLRVGDEVLTAGGIYGTISHVDDDRVMLQIAPKVEVRVDRRAVAGVNREPGQEAAGEAGEPHDDDGGEKWRSAFDEEGSSGDASNEESPG